MQLRRFRRLAGGFALAVTALALGPGLRAETGYDLWLRYAPLPDATQRAAYRQSATAIVVPPRSPTGDVIAAELGTRAQGPARRRRAARGPAADRRRDRRRHAVDLAARSPRSAGPTRSRASATRATSFARRRVGGHAATVIASNGEAGALYGAFHLLRLIQTRQPLAPLDIAERPRLDAPAAESLGQSRRHHRARLRRTIALVAGPRRRTRVVDYARANASIGINGAVINSVNANPQSLTAPLLAEGGGHRATCSGRTASASISPPTSPRRR